MKNFLLLFALVLLVTCTMETLAKSKRPTTMTELLKYTKGGKAVFSMCIAGSNDGKTSLERMCWKNGKEGGKIALILILQSISKMVPAQHEAVSIHSLGRIGVGTLFHNSKILP